MKAHTPMTDALRVNASATFDSHEKTLHAMGKLEAINADLLAALEHARDFVIQFARLVGRNFDVDLAIVDAAIKQARGE